MLNHAEQYCNVQAAVWDGQVHVLFVEQKPVVYISRSGDSIGNST